MQWLTLHNERDGKPVTINVAHIQFFTPADPRGTMIWVDENSSIQVKENYGEVLSLLPRS